MFSRFHQSIKQTLESCQSKKNLSFLFFLCVIFRLLHRNHLYQQPLFSTPAVSTPPPLVPPSSSTDVRTQYSHPRYQPFDEHNHTEQDLAFNSKTSALVRYQNPSRPSSKTPTSASVQYFDALPTIDIIDPMQTQFMYQTSTTTATSNTSDTQNQLNKFRILCNVKDRKISELENRCAEYHEKYNSDIRALKHEIELNKSNKKHRTKCTLNVFRHFRREI